MFAYMLSAVADVCCIPAASSSVVAELSVHIELTTFVTSSSWSTFPLIFVEASSILATILRRLFLISCTALAITPFSSLRAHSIAELGLCLKSNLLVLSMITVISLIGCTMMTDIPYAAPSEISNMTTDTMIPMFLILFIGARATSSSAVITSIWSWFVTAYPAYLYEPL